MTILSGADSLMKKLEAIAASMGGGAVKVGFLEGATYPDGTPVPAVAYWNEFGVPSHGQPPRPFFRQMIAKEGPTWPGKMAKLAKATNYDGPRVLALMGEDITGALKESINNLTAPALAQSTIDAKGFSKPLIDKAVMINGVGYQVDKGDVMVQNEETQAWEVRT